MSNEASVKRWSRIMSLLCKAAMFILPLFVAISWVFLDDFGPALSGSTGVYVDVAHVSITWRLVGFAVSMIPCGLTMYGLWRLSAMFQECAEGRFFSLDAVRGFRGFAWMILIAAALRPIVGAALSVVLTMGNPPGQRQLAIQFGSTELTAVFVGLLLVAIAHILEEGRKLSDDNAQIV
ncbi:MAG: DUF2975 domain-containing protein [Pseudomonadota bacterium]